MDYDHWHLFPDGIDISPCFCGKNLRLAKRPHPVTGQLCMTLEHDTPECAAFMIDRPLDAFLAALRRHRDPNLH